MQLFRRIDRRIALAIGLAILTAPIAAPGTASALVVDEWRSLGFRAEAVVPFQGEAVCPPRGQTSDAAIPLPLTQHGDTLTCEVPAGAGGSAKAVMNVMYLDTYSPTGQYSYFLADVILDGYAESSGSGSVLGEWRYARQLNLPGGFYEITGTLTNAYVEMKHVESGQGISDGAGEVTKSVDLHGPMNGSGFQLIVGAHVNNNQVAEADIQIRIGNPPYKPDGRIKKGNGAFVGNNIYNDDAAGQARSGKADPGGTIKFKISIQNDGSVGDRYSVKGAAIGTVPPGYSVKYFNGTTNITGAVIGGTYETPILSPGGTHAITVKVKVLAGAAIGTSVTHQVLIWSEGEPVVDDAVEFTGRRK